MSAVNVISRWNTVSNDDGAWGQTLIELQSRIPYLSDKNPEDLTTLEIMQEAINYIYDLEDTLNEN